MTVFFFRSILVYFFVFFSVTSFSQDLELAIKSYQSGDFNTAKELLSDSLSQDPKNALTLYNLGLTEYKLGSPGQALGYWRRAQFLSPDFPSVKSAILFAETQLQLPQRLAGPVKKASHFLYYSPWSPFFYFVALVLLLLGTRTLVLFLKKRRQAREQDQALPHFPLSPLFLILLATLILYPMALGLLESQQETATIIQKNLETKSGPDTENASLFTLNEGELVRVLDQVQGWIKIQDSQGRLGWVHADQIFLTMVEK